MAISHAKSNIISDFTGTVTVFNSQGSTVTANASVLVRPSDWNSVHDQYLTLAGNTAGVSTLSGSNIVLQGGNNITLSGVGATVIVSAGASGGGSGVAISAVGGSQSTGTIVFSNSNGISFGYNAGTITATVNPGAAAGIAAIQASNQTATSGTMVFANSNGITFGMSGSSQLTASHNGLTTARASNDGVGLATALTAGPLAWTVNSAGISLNAGSAAGTTSGFTGGASISGSITHNTAGLALSLSHPAWITTAAVSNHSHGASASNGSFAFQTLGFSNANNVTFGTSAGGIITASVAPAGAATLSVYAVSNTTQGTSGTIPGSVFSIQGNGGVSAGVSNGSIVISGPNLTSLSVTGALSASSNGNTISLGVGTVTASVVGNTTLTSTGTLNLNALVVSGASGVSAGFSNGTLVISGGGGGGGAGVALGNSQTTYTSGTAGLFVGGGALTIASTTGQRFNFSAPATSSLVGGANITISTAGSTITVIGASVAASPLSISAGTTSTALQSLVFSNSNGISFQLNGSTVTASYNSTQFAGTGTSETGAAAFTLNSLGLAFNAASLAGTGFTSTTTAGTAILATNNTAGLSMAIPAFLTAGGGGGGIALANSQTTYTSGTANLVVAGGAMTIASTTGQSYNFSVPQTSSLVGVSGINVSTNGSTISIYNGVGSYFCNMPVINATTTQTVGQSTSVVFPFDLKEPENPFFMRMPHSISVASTSFASTANTTYSYNQAETHNLVLYTRGTGANSLSLQSIFSTSVSVRMSINFQRNSTDNISVTHALTFPVSNGTSSLSFSYAATNSSDQFSTTGLSALTGVKFWDTAFATYLDGKQYWLAYGMSTTQTTQGTAALSAARLLHSQIAVSQANNTLGLFGQANAASIQWFMGQGSFSTNAIQTTASIPLANVSSSASHVIPVIQLIRISS